MGGFLFETGGGWKKGGKRFTIEGEGSRRPENEGRVAVKTHPSRGMYHSATNSFDLCDSPKGESFDRPCTFRTPNIPFHKEKGERERTQLPAPWSPTKGSFSSSFCSFSFSLTPTCDEITTSPGFSA